MIGFSDLPACKQENYNGFLTPDQISTSHRLQTRPKPTNSETAASPPIIVRFLSRDVRNQLYANRKLARTANSHEFSLQGAMNVYINENLTQSRKKLFWHAKQKAIASRGGVEDTTLEAKAKYTKKSEAKDSLSEDRHSRGQGQECSRPRPRTKDTSASALQKKKKKKRSSQRFFRRSPKKKGLHKNFSSDLHKKTFPKHFSSAPQNFNNSKNTSAVLEPRTGQFSRTWDLEAKAKDFTFEVKAKDFKICPRGQRRPRGLHLW